ncbi:hypothetical protein X772_32125 [Mesorhizobium sp. LSJC280B00]|nr:hypothetical protein X772_32125 [Mesorhizobium sp. LSJC280B00]
MRFRQPLNKSSRDNWPLQFIAMISASDKEARSLPFIEAEDRERKSFAVGAFRDDKVPRGHARPVEIES